MNCKQRGPLRAAEGAKTKGDDMVPTEKIIALADKTVFAISGLDIHGLNTKDLEEVLSKKLEAPVRVIGVTGDYVEMDVYGINPENILKNEDNVIQAVACAEGITITDLTEISSAERMVELDINKLPDFSGVTCQREKWISML